MMDAASPPPSAEAKPIQLRVDYRRLNTFFADYARNITKGGTFVRTKQPLALGTEFVFVLSVPAGAAGAEPVRIELPGLVKWIVEEDEATSDRPAGMGIAFRFEGEGAKERLDERVRGLMRESLGAALTERLLPRHPLPPRAEVLPVWAG